MARYEPQWVESLEAVYRELLRLSAELPKGYDFDPVYEDLRVPMNELKANPVTSKPDFDELTALGSVRAYRFDGASNESVFFAVQLPHGWKEGSSIEPRVHWMPVSAGGSTTVIWQLDYTAASIDYDFSATNSLTATGTASGAYHHNYASFGTIDMDGKTVCSMILCKLTRLGSTDGYNDDAALLEFDFNVKLDGIGSFRRMGKS